MSSWQWVKANPDAAARRIRELERENTTLRNAVAIIRNALKEYYSDRVNANEWRVIGTIRRAVCLDGAPLDAAQKKAQP